MVLVFDNTIVKTAVYIYNRKIIMLYVWHTSTYNSKIP
jgi:hypothetical protein